MGESRVSVDNQSDEELMALLARGQDDALAALVVRYQNDIFRFCLHYVKDVEKAKDMAQETFIRVFVARARFDLERKFRPWVLCIARNLCLNDIKRKKTVSMESLEGYASSAREDTGELTPVAPDGPAELMMADERRAKLAEVLATLDEQSREIVMLRFFERMSARDIAEIIGSTEGAVRTRVHRIIKGLRAQYIDCRDVI
jgi:RNA polymerase sigma-70 factor, ECF subfamily